MAGCPRLLRAAVLMVVAGTVLTVPATPSHAAGCSGGDGVTVVVDFASLRGGTRTGCAAGDPSSGVAALRGAGFEPTRAAQQAGYFVCRIDGKPASDPCQRASPADAYWSYWHGAPGGSWSFSETGAAGYDPEPGSVEGWAFGDGKPPSSPPPRAERPSPSPSTRPAPSPSSRTAATAPAQQPAAAPVRTSPASSRRPTATPAAAASVGPTPSVGPTAAPTPDVSPSASQTPAAAAPDVAPVSDDAGSPAGPLLAAVVVALLIAAGARQVWLRRRSDEAV